MIVRSYLEILNHMRMLRVCCTVSGSHPHGWCVSYISPSDVSLLSSFWFNPRGCCVVTLLHPYQITCVRCSTTRLSPCLLQRYSVASFCCYALTNFEVALFFLKSCMGGVISLLLKIFIALGTLQFMLLLSM